MKIVNDNIDHGKPFDFGKASHTYAQYRDIYPPEFYEKITKRGLCLKGQKVLDIGTGTGVIPRNMYHLGAEWTATDISENQIKYAKKLSVGTDIRYCTMPAEKLDFPEGYFDVVTACQCFTYFDHPTLAPQVYRLLKEGGSFVVLYMAWLPFEDKIAGESERLVLKYNPGWNGCGETVHPIQIPSCYKDHFEIVYSEEYRLNVPFTRESWNGRMKCCRGIQASLPDEKVQEWEREHLSFLESSAPPQFEVLHYAAITQLRKK